MYVNPWLNALLRQTRFQRSGWGKEEQKTKRWLFVKIDKQHGFYLIINLSMHANICHRSPFYTIKTEYCKSYISVELQHEQVRNVKLHMQMELSTKLPLSKSVLSSFPFHRLTLVRSRYSVIFSHKIKLTLKNGLKFKCCCSSQTTTKAMIEIEVCLLLCVWMCRDSDIVMV